MEPRANGRPGSVRRTLGRAGVAVVSTTFVAWAVGQTFRDATWATGLCFYVPSPVLVFGLLAFAGVSAAARVRRAAVLGVLLALPPAAVALFVENDFAAKPTDPSASLRLVHWNTGGRPGREGIVEPLVALRADLYALTDAPSLGSVEVFRRALPDPAAYQSAEFGGLAVVGRGAVRANGWLVERDEFKVQSVTWEHAGRAVELFVLDLPSDIRVARDPLLREVNALIDRHRPDFVVGDFNAPRRSRALTDLPTGYAHAYHTAGSGWGYTWPVPVPVFALDHILHGPRVRPGRYRLGSGGDSDHRYQVFDFALK